jgi:nucleoside-diphosphate-sugar epimerase
MSKVTVFGASGGIGGAIVDELAVRGHEVTAASRNLPSDRFAPSVRLLTTDLRDQRASRVAADGAEVVVMAAQVPYPRWATELWPLVEAAVNAAAAAQARLVMVDNLYAYGAPDHPIAADSPEAATTRKGSLRRGLGRWLLDRHAQGIVAVAIGRFPDYYGPHAANSLVNQLIVRPAAAGKTARVFIDGDQPHSFHFLRDSARGFATLVERPEADGHTWVLPGAVAATQRELIGHLEELLDRDVEVGRISPTMLALAGLFNRELREAREVVAQFDRPYVTDAGAFEAAFGTIEATPHREALAETLTWAQGALDFEPAWR